MFLPVTAFAPDLPARAGASALVRNCLPRTAASYGPMPSLAAYSAPLQARCQGAVAVQDAAGNVSIFAGDATKLYRLGAGSTAWTDVTKQGGYTTAFEQHWAGLLFGDRVVMTNFADPIQSFRLGGDSAFADLSPDAPRARHLAVVRDWLVLGNTFDAADGPQPQRVWWSAIDDPTSWPAPGTSAAAAAQSDFQDLVGGAGWVQGIVGNLGTADGAVFQERAIVRMNYVGPPAIFAFATAEGARGTPAPGSIAQLGTIVYYLGEDGFYAFDGSASHPIGADKIDKTFFADLDQQHLGRITAAIDPINKLCFWAYPGVGNTAGNPNRLLAYNWATDRWSLCEIEIELLLRSLSFGYSLDALDAVAPSLDSLPFSLDSRAWTGGRVLLAAFDPTHRLGYFSGASLAPIVETAEASLDGARRMVVTGARPIVDGGTPSVAIGARERPMDPVSFGAEITVDAQGRAAQRASGRFVRARITMPAGSDFTHIAGVELEAVPEGSR
ncbi:MAG: hypothetical protein IRZ04_08240 [Rhodospirillales bacterium]|nr:hypothetical protein [Rhodospirillales bacterium]